MNPVPKSVEMALAALRSSLLFMEEAVVLSCGAGSSCAGGGGECVAWPDGDEDCEDDGLDEEQRALDFVAWLHSPEGGGFAEALEDLTQALESALHEDARDAIRSGWFGKPQRPLGGER